MIFSGSKPCPVVQSELRLFAGNTTNGLLDFMYWGPADKTPQDREQFAQAVCSVCRSTFCFTRSQRFLC